MAKAFITQKTFAKGDEGDKHLSHVLREKTQRELPRNADGSPMISIYGNADIFKNALNVKELEGKKGRKTKNAYYELMAYSKTPEDTQKVIDYLSKRYGRQPLAVMHDDESNRHVHFMVPWTQDSKALRLAKKDIYADYSAVASLLNQTMTRQGEGRRMLPMKEYRMLEKRGEIERQINAEIKSAEIKKEKKMTMTDSGKYEVEMMKTLQKTYGDALEFGIKKDSVIKKYKENITANLSDSEIAQQIGYMKKDIKDGWQLFFTPTTNFNTATLENLKMERLGELPANSFVIQTGQSLSAHIPMPPSSIEKANHSAELLAGYFHCRSYQVDSRRLFPMFSVNGKTGKKLKLASNVAIENLLNKAKKARMEKINARFGAAAATEKATVQLLEKAQQQVSKNIQPIVYPTGTGTSRNR